MAKQFLNPPELGEPGACFSHGVRAGNTIWVSAQVGHDPEGRIIGVDDPQAQCRAIFARIAAVLEAGGAKLSDVVMVRGFLRYREYIQATWKVRKEIFGEHRPASTSFVVSDLEAEGALMSFEVVAMLDDESSA
jgi:3-hydroxyisobutyrate dehydrogenase